MSICAFSRALITTFIFQGKGIDFAGTGFQAGCSFAGLAFDAMPLSFYGWH
jgi:hypothetical protein